VSPVRYKNWVSISQKMAFFIAATVKASDLKESQLLTALSGEETW
jgi:hypothetical protein